MSVNQQTIAEKLDLSVATVSRSLRNHKGINPKTRARVLQAAQELGYRLSSIRTQAARPSEIRTIGVLIHGEPETHVLDAVVRTRILEGIAEQTRRQDVALQLDYVPKESGERLDNADVQPIGLRERLWRGTILVGHFSVDAASRFARQNICVKVADYAPGYAVDCVDHDDADSCEKLVNHLWELGHRQIGYIAGARTLPCSITRFGGITSALARRGSLLAPADVVNINGVLHDRHEIADLVQKRIAAGVTGWICENDRIGYDLMQDLRPLELTCPADFSICGFDNLPAPMGFPKLTSIDAPFEEMGAIAVTRLMQRLERQALDTIHTMLTCRLVDGESTRGADS